MSETKWTKGQTVGWAKSPADIPYKIVAVDGELAAIVPEGKDDTYRYWARLEDLSPPRPSILSDLAEALEDMLGAHPPISKRIGFEGSPARRAQEDQEAAIAKARAALARAKGEA